MGQGQHPTNHRMAGTYQVHHHHNSLPPRHHHHPQPHHFYYTTLHTIHPHQSPPVLSQHHHPPHPTPSTFSSNLGSRPLLGHCPTPATSMGQCVKQDPPCNCKPMLCMAGTASHTPHASSNRPHSQCVSHCQLTLGQRGCIYSTMQLQVDAAHGRNGKPHTPGITQIASSYHFDMIDEERPSIPLQFTEVGSQEKVPNGPTMQWHGRGWENGTRKLVAGKLLQPCKRAYAHICGRTKGPQ